VPVPVQPPVLIIGAGPAGLAVGGALAMAGQPAVLFERGPSAGTAWHHHYARLRLHTVKELSALPGLPFPPDAPRYVPRQGVADYLSAYAAHHRLDLRCGQTVTRVVRDGPGWCVYTADDTAHRARAVVLATGANATPVRPTLPGEAVFRGRILHSHGYRDAAPFAGQRVLVVGMGNTGAEIALDLAEAGVATTLSVRSPINVVRRDVLGRPTQRTAMLLARLPASWGDRLGVWLRDLTVGDLTPLGLRTPAISPLRQLRETGRTPVIDLGTLDLIRAGRIAVRPGIETLTAAGVRFTDGREDAFDALLLATGYRPAVQALFPELALPVDARGLPREVVGTGDTAGLCFVGFELTRPGGLLNTIADQARTVARALGQAPR
jgi:cation diffusion facilitator CzcD-associated flavoprotein CzcO